MTLPLTGYSAKTLAEWQADLRSAIRASLNATTPGLGDSANLDEGSVLGNLIDTLAARLDEQSNAAQDLYDSFDERNATGVYLDNLAAIVGVERQEATFSTVELSITTTAACVVPAGSIVADAAGQQWITAAELIFAGAGTQTVDASPADTGPIPAAAGTLTVIVTPITGWASVTNAADATPGRDRETDPELRSRRRRSLQITGAASPDAIFSRVSAVDGIEACLVRDNKTAAAVTLGTTTTITLGGHSYAVVVYPNGLSAALSAAVAQAIWDSAPAGIDSMRMVANDAGAGGGVTETVTDASGLSQTVKFSTAVDRPLTFTVTVVKGDPFPLDAVLIADVQDAIVAYVATLSVGEQPLALPIYTALAAVEGCANVTALGIVGTVDTFEIATITNPAVDIVVTVV